MYGHLDESMADNNGLWPGGGGYTNLEIYLHNIPEPATMCLLAVGALAVIRRRR